MIYSIHIKIFFVRVWSIFFCFLISWNVYGDNCKELQKNLAPSINKLKLILQAQDGHRAFLLADSILTVINNNDGNECNIKILLEYYKAESLSAAMKLDEALELFYKIIPKAEEKKMWEVLALSHIGSELCHEVVDRPIDCKKHLDKAKAIIDKHNLAYAASVHAVRISSFHRIFGDRDSSVHYAKKALEIGQKVNALHSIADAYLLLGGLEEDEGKSIEYRNKSAKYFVLANNYTGASMMFVTIAVKHSSMKNIKAQMAAIDSSLKYLQIVEKKNGTHYTILRENYKLKVNYFKSIGNKDSVNLYNNLASEANAKSQLDIDENKIQNDAIDFAIAKEKSKAELLTQRNYFLKIGIWLLCLVSVIMSWLFYNNYKNVKKIKDQYAIINQQNIELQSSLSKQNSLLTEVHHRVKNNLQLVIGMITVLSRKFQGGEQEKLLKDITTKVHSMALIHEQLYKKNNFETVDLVDYFCEMAANFKGMQAQDFDIDIQVKNHEVNTNIETAIPLGVIMTELIGNSIKYGHTDNDNLLITIELSYTEGKYLIKYRDNGPGYDKLVLENKSGNMGLSIINNMIRQLQAESRMYNENGAIFVMVFKEKVTSAI